MADMPTKIVLTVEEGLSKEEIQDLQYLLTDALGEFAARRTPAIEYVENRYETLAQRREDLVDTFDKKVGQVIRRNQLAKKLHNPALHIETESVLPHHPTSVHEYWLECPDEDQDAMCALVDMLSRGQGWDSESWPGWMVWREEGLLIVGGPLDNRAFWNESAQRWSWFEMQAVAQ
jgi:hypothetical protein